MSAAVGSVDDTQVKLEVTIELSRSMLNTKERMQQSLNEAGVSQQQQH